MQKLTKSAAILACILTSAALGVTTSAAAQTSDWRPIGNTDIGELSIDAASLKQNGDIREAWSMWNFKAARPNGNDASFPTLMSYQDLHLYNCKDKTMRLTKEIIFSGSNGSGEKRDHSDALKGMQYVKPAADTVAATMLNEVCAVVIPKR